MHLQLNTLNMKSITRLVLMVTNRACNARPPCRLVNFKTKSPFQLLDMSSTTGSLDLAFCVCMVAAFFRPWRR